MVGLPLSAAAGAGPDDGRAAYLPLHQQRESRPLPREGRSVEMAWRGSSKRMRRDFDQQGIKGLIVENGENATAWNAKREPVSRGEGSPFTIHIKHLIDMAPREMWSQDFIDGVDTGKPA